MKKALLALAAAVIASTASAQIAGSKHDLSTGYQGNAAQLGSCQFCHAPHYGSVLAGPSGAAGDDYAQIPLWNRKTPTAGTYSLYTNAAGATGFLGVGSYTCLSCHDGIADMGDTFRGTKGFAAAVPMAQTGAAYPNGNPAVVGGTFDGTNYVFVANVVDLRDDHPVGVNYTAGTQYSAVNAVTGAGLKLYTRGGNVTVECGSCHDPHLLTLSSKFLRVAPTGLCATCHLK